MDYGVMPQMHPAAVSVMLAYQRTCKYALISLASQARLSMGQTVCVCCEGSAGQCRVSEWLDGYFCKDP